ncbi:hypothetical protein [Borborobacter arsenicus]|uniref:hypothetical protein n=1 Tax=Borborobacter arsenicus TaxID=1851146 RepID=UPI0014045B2B|nr:hypothetical protein [Pseudaminobacter arsenicus]
MTMMRNALTAELRACFAGMADVLIPAYKQMPAASAVDVAGPFLDKAIGAREDLLEPLIRGLEAQSAVPAAEGIARLYVEDQEAFEAIATLASGVYYMIPAIRELIGYPGQENIPTPDPYETPSYVLDGSLRRVFERGPIYVPSPGVAVASHPAPFAKGDTL